MKFKFAFETLLKHLKRIEEERQCDYSQAKLAVEQTLDRINQMYQSLEKTRKEIQQIQSKGGTDIGQIRQREEYIDGLKIKIEADRQVARELMTVAEEKRKILLEALKEFKSLEKLKKRKYQQYRREVKKKELKSIDEIVTMRHKRGALG